MQESILPENTSSSPEPESSDSTWLIDASQLAEHLNISVRTLWRLRSAGKLPPPLHVGGCVRWRTSDIQKWIAADCPPYVPSKKR